MQYAQIGDIVFEVLSYKSHKEEQNFPYARHETIKPPSSLQFMGAGELKKISLSVRWHNYFCDPQAEYQRLLEVAELGEPQTLLIGEKLLGEYVCENIKAEFQQIDAYGTATVIDADIELTEYVYKEIQKKEIKTTKKKAKKAPQKPVYSIITRKNADGSTQREVNKL